LRKTRFRGGGEDLLAATPGEPHVAGVEGVVGENQTLSLLGGQAVFYQRQVEVFIAAIELVSDDRVADMGQVDADLMLAASAGMKTQKGEGCRVLKAERRTLNAEL
jgi:hypothetical protein